MKKKILFVASNPKGEKDLKLDHEIRELRQRIRLSNLRDNIEVCEIWAVTIEDLVQSILDIEPHILHFAGHSTVAGIKLHSNTPGKSVIIPTEKLKNVLREFKTTLNCVIFNSCDSLNHAKIISEQIEYCIGYPSVIFDNSAIAFSVGFYSAFASGKDLQTSFKIGLSLIEIKENTNGLPELFKKDRYIENETKSHVSLSPYIVHPLPPAPRFVKRVSIREQIDSFIVNKNQTILSLEGIGGCGKTALISCVLKDYLNSEEFNGVFVWSFYDEKDTTIFFKSLYLYLTNEETTEIKGIGFLHKLTALLTVDEYKRLIVLDGLERVQFERASSYQHEYGQLQDNFLKELLKRIASIGKNCKIIITTRFPLSDLQNWENSSYLSLNLDKLDLQSSVELLEKHGLKCTKSEMQSIANDYGLHALTLDHLGILASKFLDGNIEALKEFAFNLNLNLSPQAKRLSTIFRAYESYLNKEEIFLLQVVCLFRVGLKKGLISNIYKSIFKLETSEIEISMHLNNLISYHLVIRDMELNYTVHPAVRDYFYQTISQSENAHKLTSSHLLTLTQSPGQINVTLNDENLNLLEELIYHLIKAGEIEKAFDIYKNRLGGYLLADYRGEYLRGYRILSEFPNIPDYDGWLRFIRGIGVLPLDDKTLDIILDNLSYLSCHEKESVYLLRGKLVYAAKNLTISSAQFLLGESAYIYGTTESAPKFPAFRISNTFYKAVVPKLGNEEVYWLWQALKSILEESNDNWIYFKLTKAEENIIKYSNPELTIILHYTKASIGIINSKFDVIKELNDGISLSNTCGYLIFLIDLLNLKALYYLLTDEFNTAIEFADKAYSYSINSSVLYVYGGAKAKLLVYLSQSFKNNIIVTESDLKDIIVELKQKFMYFPFPIVKYFYEIFEMAKNSKLQLDMYNFIKKVLLKF